MQLSSKNVLNNFIGNKNASVSLIKSFNKSNCTGAWILRGPRGIGKAKLAENIIKALLDIKNSTDTLIHPDLLVLKKISDEKKNIAVEEVRKVSVFLSKTSIIGSYRSVLIDALTDLNTFGHNALLKILEEHSLHTSFLIIDHMVSNIPSTIKSRCKKIVFKKLDNNEIKTLLKRSNINKEYYDSYSILSNGSIGNIYNLHKNDALGIHKIYCEYVLGIDNKKNNLDSIHKLFQNKKKNNNIFTISFLILFRILKNTLRNINKVKVLHLNNIEEEVINKLSNNLSHDQITYLLNILYERKKNMINLNLDIYTSIYLTLSDIEKIIRNNAK